MNKIYFFLVLVLIVSCKKDTTTVTFNMNTNYFGLKEGRFVIYNVQEMYHDVDLIVKHDTNTYQLKTVIGEEYIDNSGRIGRKYYRYTRAISTDKWVIKDVWVGLLTNNSAELVEENQRIVKLIFPITQNKTWNQNIYNNYDASEATYDYIDQAAIISGLQFDSTLKVNQRYFKSLIDYQNQYENYATNVGLVNKFYKNLIIDNFDTLDVQKGNEIHYQLVEYGFE
jgi:hypothetical protein